MSAEIMEMRAATKRPWAGYIISGLPTLFLLLDALGKFVKPDAVVAGRLAGSMSSSNSLWL